VKQKVIFLHRRGHSAIGSKIMRCDQLAEICNRYLGDRYEFEVRSQRPIRDDQILRRSVRALDGHIVVLLKGTAKLFGVKGMEMMHARARGICIDYVDAKPSACYSPFAHIHIAASFAGLRVLENLLAGAESAANAPQVMHLTHHADPRLVGRRARQAKTVRSVYLGQPGNVYLPPDAALRVDCLKYSDDQDIAEVFDALQDYNLHYCVRPADVRARAQGVTKPFTKGFTAATLGAQVMTARDTHDAEFYLGADYPFLLNDLEDQTILEGLDKARDLYGTPEWDQALERLAHVLDLTRPERIANEIDDILSRFV